MLRYALFPNNLTADPNDYTANVQPIATKTMEDVVDKMISRGSTVTKAEVLSVFEELSLAVMQLLGEGNNVVTPLFNLSLSIGGHFTKADDSFDASRHEIKVRVNAGLRLKDITKMVKPEKVTAIKPTPTLQLFRDLTSQTDNGTLTPGGVAKIVGSLLKFDNTDTTQGIFFTATTGTVTRATMLVDQSPAQLTFVIPASLPPGTYAVSVRAMGKKSKAIREGFLTDNVTVK